MTSASILWIMFGKLSHWLSLGPMILLEINKGLEVDLYSTILSLSLNINLRVKSSVLFPFNI